ncbi:MAG: 4Fe-4S dicluster domain-containing protein [Planctomycetaceae bacterium]|jgi:ferredoxin|nr:4Fe-4S dicluster domain-containing protein [Planctomycetaceae bacterium]
MSEIIQEKTLQEIIRSLISNGKTVAGPMAGTNHRYFYKAVDSSDEILFDPPGMPMNSIKEFVFPRREVLYTFQRDGHDVTLTEQPVLEREQYIFGVRPCDAAANAILDPLFAWDYNDQFYQQRREKTTVVTMACKNIDEHCFCTSLGLNPETEQGADAILLDLGNGEYEVRMFTEKGKKLFAGKTTPSEKTGHAVAVPEVKFSVETVTDYLREHFDDPIWSETSLRCVGCGACTFVCPTCHCFDILDEGNSMFGARVKTWDTCQSALFTHHASGHNPRNNQAQRQRNRIQHKFRIYPDKFDRILCSGCGNCTRECSTSLGVRPVLQYLTEKAALVTKEVSS